MKIVFASLSGFGHIYPLLPLAIAARDAGHDISYATGERFHSLLQGIGFRTVPAGMQIWDAFGSLSTATEATIAVPPPESALEASPESLDPAVRVFNEVLPRRFATDLLPVLRAEQPALVVYQAGNPGAGLAAHRLGIPVLCHANARAEAMDSQDRWQQAGRALLRGVAAELGVQLPEEQYLLGDRYLDIYPSSLQETSFLDRPERLPLRPVPFTESGGDLPKIVLAERTRPLVYLTLGTVVGTAGTLRAAVQGLSALDIEIVVATGPHIAATELGALPANVHVERWVAQAELLRHVDLAVHHGGSGTTLSAAVAGVPQLFLPAAFDGYSNAGAVSDAGAGRRLMPVGVDRGEDLNRADVYPAAEICEAAGRLLGDPEVSRAASAIAEEIAAMPSPAEVAGRLPELC